MESRSQSESLAELGMDLIKTEESLAYIKDSECTICWLISDKEKTSKGKAVFAECERIPAKYRWAIPCDFTITVFQPNTERLADEQMRILMLHELMHIGIEVDGNEEIYSIIPHDVEDFRAIIDQYGLDWSHEQT